MKHLFTMLLALIAATANAQDFVVDGIYYNILSEDDRTMEVTESPYGYSGEVVIPAEVTYDGGTYSVTAIGDRAFYDCDALTSVSMPSVTAIGDEAFFRCSALTSVSMPEVTTIGYMAFNFCSALTSVSMPEVTTIGYMAFINCTALTSVSMPVATTIGSRAFCNCDALTSVDIPASCTFIGINPFAGCTALKEIVVDDNNPNYSSADGVLYDKGKTTLIGWPTAEGEIDIMPSVTTIGEEAFDRCSALTSVSMPAVTTIGFGAFYNCYALTSVSMPSATTIGEQAFYYCSALTSVDIPASVTMIGDYAFDGCSSLTSVYCHWDEPLECEPEFEDEIFMNATLYVPTGTVDAYRSVFPWSEFLNIEEKDYSGSGIAGTFEVDGIYYNILSEDDMTVEVTESPYGYAGDVVIPAEVTYDGGTYSVTTIGDWAFSDCSALTLVSMPEVLTIGGGAFDGCSALTLVSMPEVTTIGDWAFSECSALTSVEMPSVTTIGDWAFSDCSALTLVSMPEVLTIGGGAFDGCSALTLVSMPEVLTIGGGAFDGCSALTLVSMPEVTTIGDWAFSECYALTSAEMPAVTTIGDWAFSDCSALTSVDIPASVTMIGEGAFIDCDALTSVYCHWEQPLECYPGFEETVLANATLYVPDGCVDAYRAVKPWSNFANIEEGGYSGIADATASEVVIKVIDGVITVESGAGTASAPVVEVYSAGGQCVWRGTDSSIGGLPHGVYVVKVGDVTQKVAL